MAINLIENPTTAAPYDATDYAKQNALISAGAVPAGSIFADWEDTSAEPVLKQGAFIRYEGNYYQVQGSDEAIGGSLLSGRNYVVLTLSGTVLSAEWSNSKTGYSFDAAYGGHYNTDSVRKMILPDICDLGTNYLRGYGLNPRLDTFIFGDGSLKVASGEFTATTGRIGDFEASTSDLGTAEMTSAAIGSVNTVTIDANGIDIPNRDTFVKDSIQAGKNLIATEMVIAGGDVISAGDLILADDLSAGDGNITAAGRINLSDYSLLGRDAQGVSSALSGLYNDIVSFTPPDSVNIICTGAISYGGDVYIPHFLKYTASSSTVLFSAIRISDGDKTAFSVANSTSTVGSWGISF